MGSSFWRQQIGWMQWTPHCADRAALTASWKSACPPRQAASRYSGMCPLCAQQQVLVPSVLSEVVLSWTLMESHSMKTDRNASTRLPRSMGLLSACNFRMNELRQSARDPVTAHHASDVSCGPLAPLPDRFLPFVLQCRVKLVEINHNLCEDDIRSLAASSHGYVGADLAALCQEAAMCALRRVVRHRQQVDLTVADVTISDLSDPDAPRPDLLKVSEMTAPWRCIE
jgi:hypothetical protein